MIHLISELDYQEFESDAALCYALSSECKKGEILQELLPSSYLQEFWEETGKTEESWAVIEKLEEERLTNSATVNAIVFMSECGRTINLLCKCRENTHCIRKILQKIFITKKADVFMR